MFRRGPHDPSRRTAEAIASDRVDRLHPGVVAVTAGSAVDPALVAAWLAGRCLARGLPPPRPDRGGLRADTGTKAEVARWIFTDSTNITQMTREIDRPGHLIKLSEPAATLSALLTGRWMVESEHCLMTAMRPERRSTPPLPTGYRGEWRRSGAVTHLIIFAADGSPAARGYAAEVPGVFMYDRILTAPEHRRRGLGRAVMTWLASCRRDDRALDMLSATVAGRGLYESLGWTVYAPWSTASVPPA